MRIPPGPVFPVPPEKVDVPREFDVAQYPHCEFRIQIHPVIIVVPCIVAHVAEWMTLGHSAYIVRYAAFGLEVVPNLGHRDTFIRFGMLIEMHFRFEFMRMPVIITLIRIFPVDRVNETLAKLFFYIREKYK